LYWEDCIFQVRQVLAARGEGRSNNAPNISCGTLGHCNYLPLPAPGQLDTEGPVKDYKVPEDRGVSGWEENPLNSPNSRPLNTGTDTKEEEACYYVKMLRCGVGIAVDPLWH
jgi:hypothetical protein